MQSKQPGFDQGARLRRRAFCGMTFAQAGASGPRGAAGPDDTLRTAVKRRAIPAAVASVAAAEKTIYEGAFGGRGSTSGVGATTGSIFQIASMTKAVTTVAAMQLVERGLLKPDEPVARHLPELGGLQVLEGFEKETGKPVLRPARRPVLLKHLLTHTAGFAYANWNGNLLRYTEQSAPAPSGTSAAVPLLMFEPGTRWEYGTNTDWTGRLVEAIAGQTLEEYFQRNVFEPLGMKDTGYILPAEKFERLVSTHQRQGDGSLKENPRTPPAAPKVFSGGGGLYSTAADYVRFLQMILRRGLGAGKQRILSSGSVEQMASNQIGELSAGKMKSVRPDRSSDVDFHPGHRDGFSYGFLINATAYEGGRSAGSLAWAGLYNTFFWIDPRRGVCAVLLMQFLPFCDSEAMGLLREFERAVYGAAF